MVSAVSAVPVAADGVVRFTVADPDHDLSAARLYQELQRPYDGPELAWQDGVWSVELPAREALRIEYLLSVRHTDGTVETGPDPANPGRAPGPFGEKSVVELPGYQPPAWLDDAALRERADPPREALFPSRKLGREVRALLWNSAGAADGDRLPLLVAHDGPEYAELSGLLAYLDVATATRRLPSMHAALLAPGDRDQDYSASAAYADALAFELLPDILAELAVPASPWARVGMGASLGALAMFHAHRRRPSLFGGLLLQSGSFFQRRTDPHEARFCRFARINRFVRGVLADPGPAPYPITVRLTCGTVEENLDNNKAMAAALASQGYTVTLGRVADGHNWISWRDAFDVHLGPLLAGLWGCRSGYQP
jgi:enterochelin esterase-like enzyme